MNDRRPTSKLVALCGACLGFESGAWAQCAVQQVVPSDASGGGIVDYGAHVAIDGATAIVGRDGPLFGDGAYVVELVDGAWTETFQIPAPSGAVRFGSAVAVQGDLAVVADYNSNPSGVGQAYVLGRDVGGPNQWGVIATLAASDPEAGANFGRSVAVDGDTVVAGAWNHGPDNAGAAYVYQRDQGGPDQWGFVAKLTASNPTADAWFGFDVAIDGSTVVVGAPREEDSGDRVGAAYVFERDNGGPDAWGETKRLVSSNPLDLAEFGRAFAVEGDTVIVGAPFADDACYVFERNEGGPNNWGQLTILETAIFVSRLGQDVSLRGDLALVGANGAGTGAAIVFGRNVGGPNNWGETVQIFPPDGASFDSFGVAVSTDGITGLVGAMNHSENGFDSGAVYLFDLASCELVELDPPAETTVIGEPSTEDAGDLDGDGDVDIVIVVPAADGVSPGTLQVFLNDGTSGGSWQGLTPNTPVPVGVEPSGVVVGQFDADGNLDVAVCNAGSDDVYVFLNDGTGQGTFLAPSIIAAGDLPLAITVGDLDGNGTSDLAVANNADNTVDILEGDGAGGFVFNGQQIAAPSGPCSMEPEDFDDDRDDDLAIAQCVTNSVQIWLQEALGVQVVDLPVGNEPVDLAVGDLDGDGTVDVCTANKGDGTLTVLLNLGGAVFSTAQPIVVGDEPVSVEAIDVDADGDLDLAVVAIDPILGTVVQVLENQAIEASGSVAFGPPVSFPVDTNGDAQPTFVVGADLNGDGAVDLVTVNDDADSDNGSISVLLNVPACTIDLDGDGDTDTDDLCAWHAAPVDIDCDEFIDEADEQILIDLIGEPIADCNENLVPDVCDIASGFSEDVNATGVPDECEDCNDNGVLDDEDIARGTSDDCNTNALPDECEPDCNGNDIADECDITEGTSPDCNGNGIPDECEDCIADIDGGGVVAFLDLLALLAGWGDCPLEPPCPLDIDCSGDVGFGDLLVMLSTWGPCF